MKKLRLLLITLCVSVLMGSMAVTAHARGGGGRVLLRLCVPPTLPTGCRSDRKAGNRISSSGTNVRNRPATPPASKQDGIDMPAPANRSDRET